MKQTSLRTLKRALSYYRPDASSIIVILGLELIGTLFTLLSPWPLKLIVDGVFLESSSPDAKFWEEFVQTWLGFLPAQGQVIILCAGMALISLSSASLGYYAGKVSIKTSLRAVLKLRRELFEALQYLPLKFHDSVSSTDSTYRVAYDSQAIQTIQHGVLLPVVTSSLTLLGSLLVMFRLSPPLTLASCVAVPPVFWALNRYTRNISTYADHRSKAESSLLTNAQEVLSAVRHVKAYSREMDEVRRFHETAEKTLDFNYRLNKAQMKSAFVVSMFISMGTAFLYLVGSLQILSQALTLGSLLVFANYLSQLYGPVQSLSGTASTWASAQVALRRCFEILESDAGLSQSKAHLYPLSINSAEIRFHNVSFSYGDGPEVLHNLSLDVLPGEFLAIVGPTGQGKSTLLSLLAGFYSPTGGKILIDGQDIGHCIGTSLRSTMSLVMQDAVIFSGTIAENIGYSRPSASLSEIVAAAMKAEAHIFIQSFPNGYHTLIGDGSVRLSGGQRQRISIARAFLRDSPILLLDEPTSSLDTVTEAKITKAIATLASGRTTFLVTHRLALADSADRVVVFDKGNIVEVGPPSLLEQNGGHYAALKKAGQPHPQDRCS